MRAGLTSSDTHPLYTWNKESEQERLKMFSTKHKELNEKERERDDRALKIPWVKDTVEKYTRMNERPPVKVCWHLVDRPFHCISLACFFFRGFIS